MLRSPTVWRQDHAGGPMAPAAWREALAGEFRAGRGDRDPSELEALTAVSRQTIEQFEAGEGLDAVRVLRDVLEALRLYFGVEPPERFDSLADYLTDRCTM